uniref:Uncharacterized protein n=1 Tax=Neobodo designis TaxID=312471 RepID=A0A7S1Q7I0_NEODS
MDRGLALLREATNLYAPKEEAASQPTVTPRQALSCPASANNPPLSASPKSPAKHHSRSPSPHQKPIAAAFPEPTPASRAAAERIRAARRAEEARRQRIDDDLDLILAQRRAFESGTRASMRMAGAVFARESSTSKPQRARSPRHNATGGAGTAGFVDLDFGEMVID